MELLRSSAKPLVRALCQNSSYRIFHSSTDNREPQWKDGETEIDYLDYDYLVEGEGLKEGGFYIIELIPGFYHYQDMSEYILVYVLMK